MLDKLIADVQEAAADPRYQSILENPTDPRLIIGLGRTILKHVVPFTLVDYFNDPKVCLESQLQRKLFWHKEIKDDTVLRPDVGVDYAVALEPSLYGLTWAISEDTDPWYGEPVIQERADLDKLQMPDFFKSGIMPKVHDMYARMTEMVDGRIPVRFPGFARGPWSIACMLRGFTPLYYDLIDDPDYVHRLMRFIVDSRIHFEDQRCKFLGIKPQDMEYRWNYVVYRDPTSSDQYNDEVDGNLFSSATYQEFILPYEKELAEYYGGMDYYHSCGNLTNFLDDIVQFPGLKMLHVSPHTDLAKAHRLRNPETALQVSLDPVNDILRGTPVDMEAKTREILSVTQGENVQIWADALYEGGTDTIAKVKTWLDIARRVIAEQHP